MANTNCFISFVSEYSDEAEMSKQKQETICQPDMALQITTHRNWVQRPLSRTEMENEPSHQNTKAPHFMVITTPGQEILHFLAV